MAKWSMSAGLLVALVLRVSVVPRSCAALPRTECVAAHIPGSVYFPTTLTDAKGMLNSGVAGTDPVSS